MDRREFLKRAGIGSVALASLPALTEAAWAAHDDDDGKTKFYFVALSGIDLPDATNTNPFPAPDTIAMAGCGKFTGSQIRGGGEFIHFDGTNLGTPENVKGTGSWKATRFKSFVERGTWGVGVAGILETEIKLIPCDRPVIRGATLKVACNFAPAGIFVEPPQPEGYTLTLPGVGTFSPFTPNIGLTLFTRPCREDKDGEGADEDEDD